MSRLVEAKPRGARAFSGDADSTKDYLERVAKYVPSEILAAYLTLMPLVLGTTEEDSGLRIALLAVILLGLGILNIPYLTKAALPNQPKRKHLVMSTVAYLTWTYSIGGFWTEVGAYQEALAGILIVFVSLASGFVVPREGEQ